MSDKLHTQFCPVAVAQEVLCTRWTPLLMQEILGGSCRFNDMRRGVPRMSPALLSTRLKQLETAGIIVRVETGDGVEYHPTPAGRELKPVIRAMGTWAQQWLETCPSDDPQDVQVLMWNIRRNIDPEPFPDRRVVVQVIYPELPADRRNWWLIVQPGTEADLCSIDPGFEVDLYISADLAAMTRAWIGPSNLKAEIAAGRILFTGDMSLAGTIHDWLQPSYYAGTWHTRPGRDRPPAPCRTKQRERSGTETAP